MFDLIREIWKNPGAAFSPMPFWFWNDTLDKDELIRQLDDFHRHGVDGVVIHPRLGMAGAEYLSEEYFALVEAVCEAAAKRFMNVILYDEGMYPSGSAHGGVVKEDARLASRRLYARPADEPVPEDEEIEFRLRIAFDEKGHAADVRLDQPKNAEREYRAYNFILGYTGGTIRGLSEDEDDGRPNAPRSADLFNPAATEVFLRLTHEKYYEHLKDYFGKTVIGIFTDEPVVEGRCARLDGGIPWSWGMTEEFFDAGGDFTHLAALLFGTEDKKLLGDAKTLCRTVTKNRLGSAFYAPISAWCREHGIALMGHPAESADCDMLRYFTIPGQDLVWRSVEPGTELTSPDSVLAKCAADAARHQGLSRNSCEVFGVCGEKGNPWNFPPDEMMWYLNFLFARGTNLIIPHAFYYSLRSPLQWNERAPDVGPHSVWWSDYKKIAGYIKRMSWLNAMGTNNPSAAVLCASGHVPTRPVAPLYEEGYTFNYLSIDDFMDRAHVHEGMIGIDRYHYDILLVDGTLRLNAEIVRKLGEFEVEGGKLCRGSDFIGYLRKHAKKTTFFEGEKTRSLRFTHMTKSGCDFVILINEGTEDIEGRVVTDLNCRAERFDPFTGKTEPKKASICEGGFAYEVRVPARASYVLGFDPGSLPELGEEKKSRVVEITALGGERMRFEARRAEGRRFTLRFEEMRDAGDVTVNGEKAGRVLFRPYELDITDLVKDGENEVAVDVTPSMANTYGKPVPVGFEGCTVRVTEET